MDKATKYTPFWGRVALSPKSEHDWVSIKITDTGIGLSKEEQELIFSRIHRATDTRARDAKSVGLGLGIARSIVEADGMKIDVESTPDQGSTFSVLPPSHSA